MDSIKDTTPLDMRIETALGAEGLDILAEQLRALGAAHESAQHGATLASIADALAGATSRAKVRVELAELEVKQMRTGKLTKREGRRLRALVEQLPQGGLTELERFARVLEGAGSVAHLFEMEFNCTPAKTSAEP